MARDISIHALRVEGDSTTLHRSFGTSLFLSTPSGWRATQKSFQKVSTFQFLSTPSGWRATRVLRLPDADQVISIHALRVEGDPSPNVRLPL